MLDLYTGHRAPELRQRAIKALGTIKDPRVVPTLLARLGDAAPGVRAAAGEALAARRETTARPRLFALIKRGDMSAASPLAALATPDMIPQIAELAGSVDEGVLATTLGEYVQRGDVPDRLRVDVVRTISGMGGAAATTALVEYIASVPAKDDRPSKREAQRLLDTAGGRAMSAAARARSRVRGGSRCWARWRAVRLRDEPVQARRQCRARSPPRSRVRGRRPRRPSSARSLVFLVLGGAAGARVAAYDLAARASSGRSRAR